MQCQDPAPVWLSNALAWSIRKLLLIGAGHCITEIPELRYSIAGTMHMWLSSALGKLTSTLVYGEKFGKLLVYKLVNKILETVVHTQE